MSRIKAWASGQDLQMMLMNRFCKLLKQNRELSFARSVGQAGHVRWNFVGGKVLIDGRKYSVMINFLSDSFVWWSRAWNLTARRYNFVSVTRRSIRAESSYPALAGPQSCHGARRVRRGFCRPGTNFVAYRSVAVQGWSGAGYKSRYTKVYCGHWRGRGISYYKTVKGVGAEAKTVTSLWIIPSVLGFRAIFFDHVIKVVF